MSEAKELVLGEKYTDRYSGVTGTALEIWAHINGCFNVGLQPFIDSDGKPQKMHYAFDTWLDDELGNPVARSEAVADRAKEILGNRYRDSHTRLEGIAESVRFIENGTEQISIQPAGDGKEIPKAWAIDSAQLEEIRPPQPVAAAPRVGGASVAARRL